MLYNELTSKKTENKFNGIKLLSVSIFGQNHGFGKMPIFRLFELGVSIVQKGVFSF